MKLTLFVLAVFLIPLQVLAGSDSNVLKQRRKSARCAAYYDLSQHKSHLELQIPTTKITIQNDNEAVKPSEETLRLGLKMRALCEAYTSDSSMTTEKYLTEIQELEDKQRQIEKKVFVSVSENLTISEKVEVTKNGQKVAPPCDCKH